MAIKINTRETSIPVEVGNLHFKYSITDESKLSLRNNLSTMQKEIEKMKEEIETSNNMTYEKELERSKSVVKDAVNAILGTGAFEQLYQVSPSIEIIMSYFIQIITGLLNEIGQMNDTSGLNKYVRKLKK
jgi:hypothetical protein